MIVTITVPSDVKWIKINKDQVGYYRVNYPLEDWKTLSETLLNNLETLSVSDRAHLLNDAFSLAEATQLNYDVALDLTRYLEKEPSNVPWSVATAKLLGIKNLMYNTENYSKFLVSWSVGTLSERINLKWIFFSDMDVV